MTDRSIGGYKQLAEKNEYLISVQTRAKMWMTDRSTGVYKQLAQKRNEYLVSVLTRVKL